MIRINWLKKKTLPGGNPASAASAAIAKAVKGVCSAGLSTTVLPQASAGPNFQANIRIG